MSKRSPKLVPVSKHLLAEEESGEYAPQPDDLFIVDEQGNVLQRPKHSPPPDPEVQRQVDELVAEMSGEKTTAR